MDNLLHDIIEEVVRRVKDEAFIEVEASGRHVHLKPEHVKILFGEGHELTKVKDLSQPGQYVCKERVTISGPRGNIENVVVLGPPRDETQVEISFTDALNLGVIPPVKLSGDLEDTAGITISTDRASIALSKGLMVAKRHIHMTPEDAKKFGVYNNEIVRAKVLGKRPLIFDDVVVRVSDKYRTFMHIDYDEANACGFSKGTYALIVGKDDK
ncbi:ethanolamine utilization phosphate acetyltransferase EutD [Clostridium sp. LIBA-8841]|uniref:ethanolamine utilization phosphate acetyltransferase EutD n=1 Tax=Clostridium sp. LIBA-8841 TaxID=2987530 RepID=UPI002AC394B3|nr:ethanolamine utilization phosphate acetyltransferase EutD [Clostridium sp. LIBA-8841]MDZ5253855.1 ethanolamine utilization phosphate acetyltransferase EutD [Clostridium sp. LIBA-8841]